MSRIITCKKAVDFISKKEEGKLSVPQRFRLWQHLACCSLCRRFSAQNKVIASAFQRRKVEDIFLTAADKQAMIEAILLKGNTR